MSSNAADFSAVSPSGHTLYYNIIDASNHKVSVTHPGSNWTGYTEPTGSVTIPSNVNNSGVTYTVVEVDEDAFYWCSGITGVSFPNTIEKIGEDAFWNCNITSITIPNSVILIGEEAFSSNDNLTTVNVPSSVEQMGASAFGTSGPWWNSQSNGIVYLGKIAYRYKGNMPTNTSITFASDTKGIAGDAFRNQINISSLSLPNSLLTIEEDAFYGCTGIPSVTIPSNVKYIGSGAFSQCQSLTSVAYNALNANQSGPDNAAFLGCENFTTLTVGNNVPIIPSYLFSNCIHLSNLTIGNNVNTISANAFVGCSALTTLTIPQNVTYIGNLAFSGCSNLSTINYNAINCNTNATTYTRPFYNCNSISSIVIGNSVHKIPAYIFYSTNITNLTIPTGITEIGTYAFAQCATLTSLNFNASYCQSNNSYTFSSPFYGCNALINITFGGNVHYIPDGLFSNALTGPVGTITFPNSISYIGRYAFNGCSGISGTLSIPNGVSKIKSYSFYNCTGLTNIIVPNSVTVIDTMAFASCSSLTQMTIGTALDTIGVSALVALNSLSVINWNAINCRSNYSVAFSGSSITTFNMGSTVQTIPDYLIYGCENLSSVSFPNTLTRIGSTNFYACGLTGTLILPSSLNSVGYGVCNMNPGITAIQSNAVIPPTIESMYGMANAFNNGNYDIPVTVPCGSVSAYQNAAGWSYFTNYQEPAGCTHQISILANPSNGGSVQGGGTYNSGTNCTVTATPNSNYSFVNWTENGTPVSSNTSYSFIVNDDRTLTANFQYQQPSTYTINASADPANGGTISGAGTYTQGQTCTLIASANSGFAFLNWTENGNVVSTNANYSFTVTGNRTLVAHFVANPTNYTITVSANPSNGGTVTGGGTYQQGQQCTVIATANSNYTFIKWTENGTQVSTNPTYSFTVNSNRTLVAHFQNQPSQYTITLSANPTNGGTVSGGGTYSQGQTCTVIANANPSYSFVNWTENGAQVSTNSTYSFTVTGNRTLVANFSYSPTGYVINATAEPSYGGLVSGAGTYNQGQTCTLIATPNPNYDFANWTEGGNVVSTSPTYSFTVNGNRTLVAHFESQVYTISVSANPTDGGTVYGGGDYSAGITCHLIAVPNNNYSFLNWTENGVIVSSESDYSFVVTGNRTLTANFIFYDGIIEMEDAVSVYPNPTSNKVYIEGNCLRKIEVFNAMGVLVESELLSDNHTEIDLQHLSAGIYCLRIYTEDGAFSQSVVKE